jgi:methionyl-tRNA formyltransferase
MSDGRWRVVLISSVAPIAAALAATVRELGHEPVAVIAPRRKVPASGDIAITDATAPPAVDVVLAQSKWSLEPLIRAFEPDLTLCWGFPWLIPTAALQVPRLGSVNLHPALLPRHRGPIPLAWSIRAGDGQYGVTWHRMDAEFDTGPILAQAAVPMEPDDFDIWVVGPRMAQVALGLLPGVLRRVAVGDPGDPQRATGDEPYAGWFSEDYAEVDWSKPAREIHDQVRAWAFAMGNHGAVGPIATIDGQRVRVTRTTLEEPVVDDSVRRMDAADGPIWITAYEHVTAPATAR